ncbi:MAG: HAMP domain-containing protein [Proteobacteria bacterium]|nr:HAMP domain-containing protein [Pseudomonadota bacterium]
MNTRSLSFRLVTWYAGVLTLVFVVLGSLTLIFLRHYLESAVLDTQARRARQIADTLLASVDRTGEQAITRQVEELYSPQVNDRFIRITGTRGRVLYISGPPHDGTFVPADVARPEAASFDRQGVFERRESVRSGSVLIGAVASRNYIVEVGVSTQRTEETLSQVLLLLAVGLPVGVLIAVSGGFVLVRRALKPVNRIAQKAEDISQHNLSERLPVVQSGDELERLSISLNNMIARLEDAVQSSKRFVADASHELRTPLTVLRGELESLAQDVQLKAHTRESLGSLLEEVDRLAEVVESLLALSKLDAGEASAERVRFDLAELVTTTAEQMSLLAEDKNIRVECDAARNVIVEGDRSRMKQVVVNLLDNAIKYTPNGGNVLLRIARESDNAILEVADNGVGIPADALPHMFKRFFRVDDSRSREQGGAGLGLSIVKSICAAQGAEVDVTSRPGGGSCFRVRQPLARGV